MTYTERRRFVAGVVSGATILGAGCSGGVPGSDASQPPLDEMTVRLVDIRQPEVGLTSATFPLILGFKNPTDREIPSISGDLDVFLNETRIGSDEPVVNALEPGEESMYDMDILVEFADVSAAVVNAIKSGTFDMMVRGELNSGGASKRVSLGE